MHNSTDISYTIFKVELLLYFVRYVHGYMKPWPKNVDILRSDTTSKITPFSRECVFTPLWKTIKYSGRAGSGRKDRL